MCRFISTTSATGGCYTESTARREIEDDKHHRPRRRWGFHCRGRGSEGKVVPKPSEDYGGLAIRGRRTNHRTTECAEQTPHCPGHCTVHGLRNLRTVWPESCKSFEISNLRAVCGWLHGEGTSNPSVIHPMASSVQSLEDGAHHAGRSWIGKLARVRDGGREIVWT